MPATLTPEHEAAFRELLAKVLLRFGAAVKVWTAACLGLRGDANPAGFIDGQSNELFADLQTVRWQLASLEQPSPAMHEQVQKLVDTASELRDVFETLAAFRVASEAELDLAMTRLQSVWQQARMRVSFLAVLIPLPPPLPALSVEQESHYQAVLDGLYDRFDSARAQAWRQVEPATRTAA